MKTLITTLAVLTLSFTTLPAKDGTFASVVIHDGDDAFQLKLASRQWIKVTNFTQNTNDNLKPAELAGIAVFQGSGNGLWVLFADGPTNTHVQHDDVFVAGPVTIYIPAKTNVTAFLTYERGSD
jgi:hypothetical protein